METIMQNITAAMSAIMLVVLALVVVTNIIVQVLKKLTWEKIPTNMMATAVAMVLTVAVFFAVCEIAEITVTWYMVAGAVVIGFFTAFAAMFGFDKLRQTLEQFTNMQRDKR